MHRDPYMDTESLTRRRFVIGGTVAAALMGLLSPRRAAAYSDPEPWKVNSLTNAGTLAKTIVIDKNPYYDASDAESVPRALKSGRLVFRKDFRPNLWDFDKVPVVIPKALHFGYAIGDPLGDDLSSGAQKRRFSLEYILIGFSFSAAPISEPADKTDFGGSPDNSHNTNDLGNSITKILVPKASDWIAFMKNGYSPVQGTTKNPTLLWPFRQLPIHVDTTYSIPFYLKDPDGRWYAANYYFGYEGGGGY